MDCQISRSGDIALVEIVGSLDSSWSQYLAERLDEVVRTGAHEVQVDMSGVSYLSSNGIALLVRYHRQMRQIGGRFRIVSDSDAVGHVLKLTGVSNLLKNDEPPTDPRIRQARVGETFETDGMTLHVRKASRNQPCERLELMGDATRLPRKGYSEADDLVWRSSPRKAAIGLGALGPNFAACRARYGEFLAAGGVSTYRPSEGTGHPDFEQVAGSFVPEIHVLYGIGFTVPDGSTMVRYEAKGDPGDAAAPLHAIAQAALLHGDCGSAGIVMIGETAGLVGAAMRRSPIDMEGDMDVFAYAHARDWLSLTPEPEHARSTAIVVGVATQSPSRALAPFVRQLSPVGPAALAGHFHAAVVPYRPLPRGSFDLISTIQLLFEPGRVETVLHLIADCRPILGAGESAFTRGVFWVVPLADPDGMGSP